MTPDGLRRNAGWYPEPEGSSGQRWWNGSQWTSHTRGSGGFDVATELEGQPPIAWSASDAELATIDPPQRNTAYFTADAQRECAAEEFDQPDYQPVLPAPPVPLAIPPGWYPDPTGLPAQRWWDGLDWTKYQAPLAGHYPNPAGYRHPGPALMVEPPKSVGVAFLLTFFFGPLGMLYSTVSGALIMLAAWLFGGVVVGIMTFGLGWLVWWPAVWLTSMIWGCVAAGNQPSTPVVTSYR